ncbi:MULTISPECIES: helix-turn-helix domain-containing protein [Paenibacillus]|uniref:XRE family transcriptional regulator n=4 Tax=Paenibacillus TaxID=44249 RepID=A0A081NZU9_9BACL|nr:MULTISPECIES: helix-turn-helix transcriptional regulator [Paenibacillus]KEQ23972.1 XRE family transcriptional regulator [Paenibacillus tyrfis]KPV58401.1 XRE family transcriptional regulator [Paenibacillus sp. A3]KZE78965.1 XRE family transcriptional regulator [Paenibacillus elgii]MBU7320082.1 helix-turn-helix domain-containing protein [Paenibacillus oleatilyticus]MCM3268329.1 helix-turn-helix domain-containing protein [Paenibacillus elgii]
MGQIGNRIAALREKQGLTQEELSLKLDISRASLSHYEKNRREPDYDTLVKIANHFKVSIDYLLGRTQDPEMVLDQQVRQFVDSLELSDERILQHFTLTIDGKQLTPEEAKRFIAFVRAERSF